jgi:hypothetical protein
MGQPFLKVQVHSSRATRDVADRAGYALNPLLCGAPTRPAALRCFGLPARMTDAATCVCLLAGPVYRDTKPHTSTSTSNNDATKARCSLH